MSKGVSQCKKAAAEVRRMKRTISNRKFMVRVRLAKRDLDYAESGCAASVTVEVRGNRVVETRGQVCISSRCNFTTHN